MPNAKLKAAMTAKYSFKIDYEIDDNDNDNNESLLILMHDLIDINDDSELKVAMDSIVILANLLKTNNPKRSTIKRDDLDLITAQLQKIGNKITENEDPLKNNFEFYHAMMFIVKWIKDYNQREVNSKG